MVGVNSVDGLISGMNTTELVDSMIELQRGTARQLENKKELAQLRLEATRNFNVKLLSAKLDLVNLRRSSTYSGRSVTSSDTGVATASVTSAAKPGTYSVTVDQVAQAHQLSTAGFASDTAAIGTGEVRIQVGNGEEVAVAIDAGASSLQGLADAINASDAAVEARLVDDGSDTPYRLVLTATETGAENTIAFDASGLSGSGSDALQAVSVDAGNTGTYAGAVAISGAYEGTDMPSAIDLRVTTAGDNASAAFEFSTDGGDTWQAIANDAGSLDLKTALGLDADAADFAVSFGAEAGSLDVGDTFTVRPRQQLQGAQDAQVRFGSSSSSFSVTRSDNTFADLIKGVTIQVASQTGTTTLTVGQDAEPAVESIRTFVEDFNDAAGYLAENTAYNPETGEAGILQSRSGLRRDMDELVRELTDVSDGLDSAYTLLSQVGIRLTDSGTLELDDATLQSALNTDPDAVYKLFANTGTSSNDGIEFVTLSEQTELDRDFQVEISRAAERARLTGGIDLSGGATIGADGDDLELEVNGKRFSITLANDTYADGDALVAHIQQLLDDEDALTNDRLTADLDENGHLRFTSQRYGTSQTIDVIGGDAADDLGLSAGDHAAGVNVAGTINGVNAIGNGQALEGAGGSDAAGLVLLVDLNETQVAAGDTTATVQVNAGVAQRADEALLAMTDDVSGSLPGLEDQLTNEIERLGEQVTKIDERLAIRRERLMAEFRQMEQIMAQFQTQGDYLTQQIESFQNLAASKAGRG